MTGRDETHEPEVVELEVAPAPVLEAQTRAEIDIQIATAKRYPRQLSRARERVLEMATATQETAEACFYALPRGGQIITGPSARLAEIVASAYGNVRAGARIVAIEERYVTAQGVCHDLERNVFASTEVKRRIVDVYGKRYNDDMIMVTSNAACAIALRNAVFKVIPMSLFAAELAKIRRVAAGDERTMKERLAALVEWYAEQGVSEEQLCAQVGRRSIEDFTLEDVALLRDIANAIKDDALKPQEVFAQQGGLGARMAEGRHRVGKTPSPARKGESGGAPAPSRPPGTVEPPEGVRELAKRLGLDRGRAWTVVQATAATTPEELIERVHRDREALLTLPQVGVATLERVLEQAEAALAEAPGPEAETPAEEPAPGDRDALLRKVDQAMAIDPQAFDRACADVGVDLADLDSLDDLDDATLAALWRAFRRQLSD